jgi:excisionase family DNA binding protein
MARVIKLEKGWWQKRREPVTEPVTFEPRKRKLSNKYFTVKELATRFNVSVDVFYEAIRDGHLRAETLGRIKRISEEDLQDYLDARASKKRRAI